MPIASLTGRTRSTNAIRSGLEACGFTIATVPKENPEPGDVLVTWNRLPTIDEQAKRYERSGNAVIVMEHGWIGADTYAIALSQHNGAGRWPVGESSRWPVFGIGLRPWRERGDHILVIPQRGMGTPPVAMPRDWREKTETSLARMTTRPVRVRNPKYRAEPLEPDFKDCHAVITWASGAGIKAIVAGIPVFHEMPLWIGGEASRQYPLHDIEDPYLGDRTSMLHKLSWAMWTQDEVATGEPFRCLLQSLRA